MEFNFKAFIKGVIAWVIGFAVQIWLTSKGVDSNVAALIGAAVRILITSIKITKKDNKK